MRHFLAVVALLAGCTDNPQPPDLYTPWFTDDLAAVADLAVAAPDLALTAEGLPELLGKARCQYDARCGWRAASTEPACENAVVPGLAAYPTAYSPAEAIAAGRLTLDSAAARACIAAWATAGCGLIDRAIADGECRAYVAARTVGQSCLANAECVGGYCQGSVHDGCGGSCAAWIANGQPCDPAKPLCDAATAVCLPSSSTCVALVGSGAPCGANALCQHGLVCVDDPAADGGATGFCRATGALGEPCVNYRFGFSSCNPGLYCDDSGAAPSVCAKRKVSGDICGNVGVCADGLDCIGLDPRADPVIAGVCGAYLDAGHACNPAHFDSGCARDLRCDAATSTCVAAGLVNSDCSATGFCRDHLYCDTSGKCSPVVPFAGTCVPPATANDPDPCDNSTCDPTTNKCTLVCR